jgi:hypothetical protein
MNKSVRMEPEFNQYADKGNYATIGDAFASGADFSMSINGGCSAFSRRRAP